MRVEIVTDLAAGEQGFPCTAVVRTASACMLPGRIWIASDFIAKAESSAMKFVFMHEMGHQFDWAYMTEASRRRFEKLIEMREPWWGSGVGDPASPGERFADIYAECADESRKSHGSPEERAQCDLIRHVAKGRHFPPLPRYPEGITG